MLDIVKGLHQTLEEKKSKLKEIQDRYNEELAILKAAMPKKQDNSKSQAICPSCNAEYTPGEMLFCRKCGNNLSETPSSSSNSSTTQSAPSPKCNACNATLLPDAIFCNSCGNKVRR